MAAISISCSRPSAGNAVSAHAVHPPTVICSRSMRAGGDGSEVGGERCDQHQCLRYSFCREVYAQRRWAPAATSLEHWPGDISYQITLTATTSQWGISSLAVVNGLIKNFILFTRGHWCRNHDRDQIVEWRHDHRSLKWSHEHSPTLYCTTDGWLCLTCGCRRQH